MLVICWTLLSLLSAVKSHDKRYASPKESSCSQFTSTSPKNSAGTLKTGSAAEGNSCDKTTIKDTIRNLDYSFLGYDILKGDPLSTDRDPGLTVPIFEADYTSASQTADCQYSLPKGVFLNPIESCRMSFSSTEVKSQEQLMKALSTQANAAGGESGFDFLASSTYQTASVELSTGEFLYVISDIQCQYYYTMLDFTDPPILNPGFLDWADKLTDSATTNEEILEFISYYGTHFISNAMLGAKFTLKHRISQSNYETLKQSKFSLKEQANYAGELSLKGGASLDDEQKEVASNFLKLVETTAVVVGSAPPSNGQTAVWAALVKNNPVPTKLTLQGIDRLFGDEFLSVLTPMKNYSSLRQKLKDALPAYCESLKKKGEVISCESVTEVSGVDLAVFGSDYWWVQDVDLATCKRICVEDEQCIGVQHGPACRKSDEYCLSSTTDVVCKLLKASLYPVFSQPGSTISVFFSKLRRNRVEVGILHVDLQNPSPYPFHNSTLDECKDICSRRSSCDAYYLDDESGDQQCRVASLKSMGDIIAGSHNIYFAGKTTHSGDIEY